MANTVWRIGVVLSVLLHGCPIAAQVCGNGAPEADEQCDDGNAVGGDGCAANCTTEIAYACALGTASQHGEIAQIFPLNVNLDGVLRLYIGDQRSNGTRPISVPASEFYIAPYVVPGAGTICIIAEELSGAGAGNAGVGTLGCGAAGLPDVSYSLQVDHNTAQSQFHYTAGGGTGAAVLRLKVRAYALLNVTNACFIGAGAENRAKGADGIACTSDDPAAQATNPVELLLTTGTAQAEIVHLNGGGATLSRTLTGSELECSQLPGSFDSALEGLTLVGATARLDVPGTGDTLVVEDLRCERWPDATPTATCAAPSPPPATATRSATATSSPEASETPIASATAISATASPTNSSPPTSSPIEVTPTRSATPDPTHTATSECDGDCDGSGAVTVDEIVRGVNIALGILPVGDCSAFDRSSDGSVTVDEIIVALNLALTGCTS